jgi:hypothetical protein
MNVQFTDSGHWQLRAAVDTLRRRDLAAAERLLNQVEALIQDPKRLEEDGARLSEFPDFPQREWRAEGYRIFVRRQDDRLWITGVWSEPRRIPS